jgi:hypothetical protein
VKLLVYTAALLVAVPVWAESSESSAKSSLKQDDVLSAGNFHGLTFNCKSDDNDEVETTPGSPPLDVDDPATPGCKAWEINIVMDGDLSRAENVYELPLFDINYGIGDNLQLKYEIPYSVSGTSNSSFGATKLGVKFQFYGNDDAKTQMAIYPQVTIATPGKKTDPANGASGTITTLPFLMSKRLTKTTGGDIMLTGNIGYNLSTRADTQNYVSGALGIGAPLAGKTSVLFEIATEQALKGTAEDPRQEIVKADVAAMGPLNKHLLLFGLVGQSLVASDNLDHTYVLTGFRYLPGD